MNHEDDVNMIHSTGYPPFDEFFALRKILSDDVQAAIGWMKRADNQQQHTQAVRVYVRAQFAEIEGLLFGAKPITLRTDETGWQKFQDTVHIRDRLMHPKDVRSLLIHDIEREIINETQVMVDGAVQHSPPEVW